MRDNPLVKREDRIREARRRAAERAVERAAEARSKAARVHGEVTSLGSEAAQRRVSAAEQSGEFDYLGPIKTPHDWGTAVDIAREIAIEAARRRSTITYGEVKLAIHEMLGKLVGWSMFAELAMSVNKESDGVLLSSIIVHKDDGMPGDGFRPYAASMGFDEPLPTLQRRVFDHFSGSGKP